MRCELCDKKIKGFFVQDAMKGVKSAALSFIGRNSWVHKCCYKYTCQELMKKKKRNTMENMMVDDYKMMVQFGDIK